jgi:hypothetical protein
MPTKTQRILGWVLSGLIALFLIVPSATPKLVDIPSPQFQEMMKANQQKIGWDNAADTMKILGVVEILSALLYLFPRTAFVGSILVTGYLGGAMATHARIGEFSAMPFVMAILLWVGYALRNPVIFRLAVGSKTAA